MQSDNEIWKSIKDWDNYEVSDLGQVRNKKFGRVLKLFNHRDGYALVDLAKDGVGKTFTVHRLVANAFLLNEFNRPQIDHRDGNKKNNTVSNLSWVTPLENCLRKTVCRNKAWSDESRRFLAISV
jgi:hypothetical protein